MKTFNYRIMLRKEPEGGFTVIVPSLPGCITYGDTMDEAIEMAREAIDLYLESLRAHGETIPTEEDTFEYTLTVKALSWSDLTRRLGVAPLVATDVYVFRDGKIASMTWTITPESLARLTAATPQA